MAITRTIAMIPAMICFFVFFLLFVCFIFFTSLYTAYISEKHHNGTNLYALSQCDTNYSTLVSILANNGELPVVIYSPEADT